MTGSKGLFTGLAVLVAFLGGFIVGEMQNSAPTDLSQNGSLDLETLQQAIRQELQAHENGRMMPARMDMNAHPESENSLSAQQGRTPSWDQLIERLTLTIARLESATNSMEQVSETSVADQVRLARNGQYPQKHGAVRDYCRRMQAADEGDDVEAYERVREELLFLSPTEILQKYGEPTHIELEVGSMSWEFSREWETADGDDYYWYLELTFTEGAVMDINSGSYEGD